MNHLAYGNGVHGVQANAQRLHEIDLLPNLPYMEMLLKVVDYAVADLDPGDQARYKRPDRLTDLLIDLCLARFHRDAVGQAAAQLGNAPGHTYQGDVCASLQSTFTEMFPGLDMDEAKRVAHAIAYGWSEPMT